MRFLLLLFLQSLLFPGLMEAGEAQAVGIDLSTTFVYASYYDISSEKFTNIATISPPIPYHNFMWEIHQRYEILQHGHLEAWQAFARTAPWRNLVLTVKGVLDSSGLPWVAKWLPHVLRNEEFRYPFNNDLDETLTAQDDVTWIKYILKYSPVSFRSTPPLQPSAKAETPGLQLSNANFVQTLTETLEKVQAAAFANHKINITSAVVSKPAWLNNQLDPLLEQACTNAEIQLLSQLTRPEAAMLLTRRNGGAKPLVIEHSSVGFSIYSESSSMSDAHLGAAFVPHLLLEHLLSGKHFNGSQEDLTESTYRLRSQIVKGRAEYWYQHTPKTETDRDKFQVTHENEDGPGFQVVVADFGEPGTTLNETISSKDLQDAEDAYKSAVEDAVERAVLRSDRVVDHLKSESLVNATFDHQDWQTQRQMIRATAGNTSIPEHTSWWAAVDEVVVLADPPDHLLLLEGALRALRRVPGFPRTGAYPLEYLQHDLAARGAALDAAERVRWDEEVGDDDEDQDQDQDILHEEL